LGARVADVDPGTKTIAVTSADVEAAAAVLANAFAMDPVFRYILGENRDIEQHSKHLFAENIKAELRKPTHLVQRTNDGNAVAIWHDIDSWKTPPAELLRSLPSTVRAFGRSLPRALRVLLSAEKLHPSEPHRHLAYIGTHRDYKGKGHGTALLGSMLERCDSEGVATYLESTNPANDAWYGRFGFVVRGAVRLPAGAPIITTMWRDPR
jgi:GNAT superfamily N-acetyltransferase